MQPAPPHYVISRTGNGKRSSSWVGDSLKIHRLADSVTHDPWPFNPESIRFDRESRTTIVPCFKSFRSGVFVCRANVYTHIHTHIATKWSQYPRRRASARLSVRIIMTASDKDDVCGCCVCVCVWIVELWRVEDCGINEILDGSEGDRLLRWSNVAVVCGCPMGCIMFCLVSRDAAVTSDELSNYLGMLWQESVDFHSCTLLMRWQWYYWWLLIASTAVTEDGSYGTSSWFCSQETAIATAETSESTGVIRSSENDVSRESITGATMLWLKQTAVLPLWWWWWWWWWWWSAGAEVRRRLVEEHRRRCSELDGARRRACQLTTILAELNETFAETRQHQTLPCYLYSDMDRMLRQVSLQCVLQSLSVTVICIYIY